MDGLPIPNGQLAVCVQLYTGRHTGKFQDLGSLESPSGNDNLSLRVRRVRDAVDYERYTSSLSETSVTRLG
jgi:hypothetical protein